ncbi:Universal stres protein A-like protein [Taenia solium]|eukprot:TsM_000345000 transcript=TsM_000345000 gene=TsM_000345000
MGRTYLLPIDTSENCKRALKFYTENLHRDDDTVIFLHVIEPTLKANSLNIAKDEDSEIHEMSSQLQKSLDMGKALGHKYLAWGREAGFDVKAFVRSDSKPGVAIMKAVRELNVDHIVVGSRGLNALGRALLGSVSSYVIHHSQIPVTVVPCREEEKPTGGRRRLSLY